jgi:hypothetical protein
MCSASWDDISLSGINFHAYYLANCCDNSTHKLDHALLQADWH